MISYGLNNLIGSRTQKNDTLLVYIYEHQTTFTFSLFLITFNQAGL